MTDNTEPNLDSIINLFISKINANEQTSNYIFDEDYVAVAELKRDFEGYIADQVAKARIDEIKRMREAMTFAHMTPSIYAAERIKKMLGEIEL